MDVDAWTRPVARGDRSAAFVVWSQAACVLGQVSGGMMDVGWADRVVDVVRPAADAFVAGGGLARFVDAVVDALTAVERADKLFGSVELAAIQRVDGGWRVGRIGGARLFAVGDGAHGSVHVVGAEDVIALPQDGPTLVSAALVPRGRWRVDRGPGWTWVDESHEAATAVRRVRVDDVADARRLVVVAHPGWTALDVASCATSSAQEIGAAAGGAPVVVLAAR